MTQHLWKPGFVGFLLRSYYRVRWRLIEKIPDDELLWRAVHSPTQIDEDGKLKAGFFRDSTGLSCDLAKFTTEKRAILGQRRPPRPEYAGLVEFSASAVREPAVQSDISHKPEDTKGAENYAHSQLTTYLTTGQAKQMIRSSRFRKEPDVEKVRANR